MDLLNSYLLRDWVMADTCWLHPAGIVLYNSIYDTLTILAIVQTIV